MVGSAIASCHGTVSAGIRANHSSPSAMRIGPTTRNRRAPWRPAIVPIRADSSVSMIPVGTPISSCHPKLYDVDLIPLAGA